MPEQLTVPPEEAVHDPSWRSLVLPLVRQVVVILLVFAAAGALAGVVWEWLWKPPTGVVLDHRWLQDEAGLRGDFAGTGSYVLVAAVTGLLVAAALALVFDRAELVTLVTVLVGAYLAGWLMYHVGLALGPVDPQDLARTAPDNTHLPGKLIVSGASPERAFPAGALVGLVIVFFGLSRRRQRP
jgi:hypothetical protein